MWSYLGAVGGAVSDAATWIGRRVGIGSVDNASGTAKSAFSESLVPKVWLLGKVQSGKTSIIASITGEGRELVGNGYLLVTDTIKTREWPPDRPLLRFLDTRGLEDRDDYDPSEEVRLAEQQAHIILVSVRAEDMGLDAVQSQLAAALKRNPTRPVIVAQTRLHDLYPPSFTHIQPWPYGDEQFSGVPSDLRRALQHQRMLFRNAVCPVSPTFVPIDFTNEKDGFSPLDYGATALRAALRDALLKSRNTNHPEAPDAQTYEHDLKSNLDGAKAS